ncbi:MAG: hypothetical protein ACPGJS_05130 [Flammeovirgaceae bacterium]
MHKLSLKTLVSFLMLFIIVSCGDDNEATLIPDEKDPDPVTTSHPLENTVWKREGVNCHVYYIFNKDRFIYMNACFNTNDVLDNAAWHAGTYTVENEVVSLTIDDSCEEERIGISTAFEFNTNANVLSLTPLGLTDSWEYKKLAAAPEIPADAQMGYWDFEGGGSWIHVESCNAPY